MGGVAFVATAANIQAVLWLQSFPSKICQRLVSFENPTGDVTNSDLELAATVAHHDVLTTNFDLREHTIHSFHDNTPAQYWQRKGSTTTLGPAASLPHLQSHHQRHFRYVPVHDYLAGVLNRMGDDVSLLFELSDTELLTYFNRYYPQTTSWRLLRLRPEWHSLMISSLVKRPSAVVSSKGLTQDRADRHWALWLDFCQELDVDPLLCTFSDPVPFLQSLRDTLSPTA